MNPFVTCTAVVLAGITGAMAQVRPDPGSRLVRGQVVEAATGAPLRRARVVVSSGATVMTDVFTNDEGRFSVETTLPSPLTVRVTKAAFAPSLGVAPVSGAADMRVALERSAAIEGRVLDQHGAPVTGAYIAARPAPARAGSPGQPVAGRVLYTQSDELGEYRLSGLPGGRYAVSAVWLPLEQRQISPETSETVLFGSARSEIVDAQSVLTLAPGDELADMVLTFAAVPPSCRPATADPLIDGTAMISGRVTGPSGEPLCAMVRIIAPDDDRQQVLTDQEGRYALTNLRAGSFIVEAEPARDVYGTLLHGQRSPSDAEVPVTLRAGEHRGGTDLILPRRGMVSGTVLDEHGEPMEGVPVQAFRLSSTDGRSMAAGTNLSRPTDDRGRYRITGLEPGDYVVRAMVQGEMAGAAAGEAPGYASVFYPGTPDVTTARRVALDVDAHIRETNIVVMPTPTTTVSGVVADNRGRPVAAAVTMTLSARSGAPVLEQWSARSGGDGAFAIRNVPPGEYAVKAVVSGQAVQPFGMQYARVAGERSIDVSLVVAPPATVEGRVIVEGAAVPNATGIVVGFYPTDGDYTPPSQGPFPIGSTSSAAAGPDGRFLIGSITGPSLLQVRMLACDSCYLKSATLDGVDVTDRPFDFGMKGGEYRDAEIVMSRAGATVEGRVRDLRTVAAAAVSVVVFPTDRALWTTPTRHVKMELAAADGSFQVVGLPPGEYLVAAVSAYYTAASRARLVRPEALDELTPTASRVTLSAGQRRFVELRPTARPR